MVSSVLHGRKQSKRVRSAIIRQELGRHARKLQTAASLIEMGR